MIVWNCVEDARGAPPPLRLLAPLFAALTTITRLLLAAVARHAALAAGFARLLTGPLVRPGTSRCNSVLRREPRVSQRGCNRYATAMT